MAEALDGGARGFLLESGHLRELLADVHAIADGGGLPRTGRRRSGNRGRVWMRRASADRLSRAGSGIAADTMILPAKILRPLNEQA